MRSAFDESVSRVQSGGPRVGNFRAELPTLVVVRAAGKVPGAGPAPGYTFTVIRFTG